MSKMNGENAEGSHQTLRNGFPGSSEVTLLLTMFTMQLSPYPLLPEK